MFTAILFFCMMSATQPDACSEETASKVITLPGPFNNQNECGQAVMHYIQEQGLRKDLHDGAYIKAACRQGV